jgi:hypothetical protein
MSNNLSDRDESHNLLEAWSAVLGKLKEGLARADGGCGAVRGLPPVAPSISWASSGATFYRGAIDRRVLARSAGGKEYAFQKSGVLWASQVRRFGGRRRVERSAAVGRRRDTSLKHSMKLFPGIPISRG